MGRDFERKQAISTSMNHGIIDAMCSYAARRPVRMHMPGHKGKRILVTSSTYAEPTPQWARGLLDDLRAIDMTESPGLDNLHYPRGCIRETEAYAEEIFGSARSYFLVNGATSGVQASLLAARMVLGPGTIVLPRNVHRSMVSAMTMSGLEPVFAWPEYDPKLGGYLPLDKKRLSMALSEIDEAASRGEKVGCAPSGPVRAILILNPTYSGFARDLSEIAEIAHARGALLIVDEAHGTHFKFGKDLPPSALEMGADLVVHGAHKTTVAFTQTGLLHVGKKTPDRFPELIPAVEEALRAVQTTSPSYILMASLEEALDILGKDNGAWVNRGVETARKMSFRLSQIPGISVVGYDPKLPVPPGLMHDPGRILVGLEGLDISGPEAANFLVREERVDPEMTGPKHLLLIWTGADGEKEIAAVERAFQEMAKRFPGKRAATERGTSDEDYLAADWNGTGPIGEGSGFSQIAEGNRDDNGAALTREAPKPKKVMPLREAFLSVSCPMDIRDAVGKISADTVVIYPPGSPIIAPGELFDEEVVKYILEARRIGLNVVGRGIVSSGTGAKSDMKVYCVKE